MFRKFSADHIFDGHRLRSSDYVLVCSANGTIEAILPRAEAGEGVEYLPGLIMPGFVNCHCHLDLSHLKGQIPQGTGLVDFLLQVMNGRNAATAETKNDAMFRAMDQMHKTGTVAAGDICAGDASLEVKKFSSLYWHNFIEVTGVTEDVAPSRMQIALQLKERFENALPDSPAIPSPHAPYSVSPSLLQQLDHVTQGEIISIHNEEARAENELFLRGEGDFLRLYQGLSLPAASYVPTGTTSFEYWLSFFNNHQRIISVHNTFIETNDIVYAKTKMPAAAKLFYCLCPNANLYIEKKLPPVPMLLENGLQLVLGTDSLASNHRLDVWEEVKTLFSAFSIPPETLLSWATSSGAEALGVSDRLGSFEPGKRPGIVHIRKFHLQFWGESSSARIL